MPNGDGRRLLVGSRGLLLLQRGGGRRGHQATGCVAVAVAAAAAAAAADGADNPAADGAGWWPAGGGGADDNGGGADDNGGGVGVGDRLGRHCGSGGYPSPGRSGAPPADADMLVWLVQQRAPCSPEGLASLRDPVKGSGTTVGPDGSLDKVE